MPRDGHSLLSDIAKLECELARFASTHSSNDVAHFRTRSTALVAQTRSATAIACALAKVVAAAFATECESLRAPDASSPPRPEIANDALVSSLTSLHDRLKDLIPQRVAIAMVLATHRHDVATVLTNGFETTE